MAPTLSLQVGQVDFVGGNPALSWGAWPGRAYHGRGMPCASRHHAWQADRV